MKDKGQGRQIIPTEVFAQGTLITSDGRPVRAVSLYPGSGPPSDGRTVKALSYDLRDGLPVMAVSEYPNGTLVTGDGRPVHAFNKYDSQGNEALDALHLDFKNGVYYDRNGSYGTTYGPEATANGTFDTDSAWSKGGPGVTWANGQYTVADVGGSDSYIAQQLTGVKSGQIFTTTVVIAGGTQDAAGFRMRQGSGAGQANYGDTFPPAVVANMTFPFTWTFDSVAGQDNPWITFLASNTNLNVVLDSVSVKVKPGICQVPGYVFSRSGEEGEIDGNGTSQFFMPNAPAIVSGKGYFARAAVNNLETYSQAFGSRPLTNATVGADTVTAPDGTTTADMLTATAASGPCAASNAMTVTAAAAYTSSVFIPAGGTSAFAYLQVNTGSGGASGAAFITIDRSSGAVSASQQLVAGLILTPFAIPVAGGWRLVVTYTMPAGVTALTTFVGLSDASASRNSTVGKTLPLWQSQTLAGTFPDGGPIIRTTSAAAGDGAAQLSATVNPITADQDFIWWGVGDMQWNANYALMASWAGNNGYIGMNARKLLVNSGSGDIASAQLPSGRVAVMMRRRAGKTTLAYKAPDGTVTVAAEGAASTLGAAALTSALYVGEFSNGTDQWGSNLEGVFVRLGTFSDADITSILQAA